MKRDSSSDAVEARGPHGRTDSELADRRDLLLTIVSRFDHYIGSTNAKAALVAAFNTFAVGAIILKWDAMIGLFGGHPRAATAAGIFLSVAALSSVLSLSAVFLTVKPYLRSVRAPGKYHSLFFFQHVAEHADGGDYLDALLRASEEDVVSDLALQAHALGTAARSKFRLMNIAVLALVAGELGSFALLLVVKLWTVVF